MSTGPRTKIPFRRRREGKTDYRRRLNLLKGGRPRAVVRRSLQNITIQIVEYSHTGDKVIACAFSKELRRFGWTSGTGNLPAAYLTGLLAGKRAKKKGVTTAVLDIGLSAPTPGSRVFASLKGLLDSGIDIPHDEGVLPKEERFQGKHIGENVMQIFKEVKAKLEAA